MEIKILLSTIALACINFGCLRGKFELHGLPSRSALRNVHVSKLGSSNCVDPDLGQVEKGVFFTGCDGSLVEGSLGTVPHCSQDGQQGCINKSDFRSVDVESLRPSDIRIGKTVAGVIGAKRDTKVCRNTADLVLFDSTQSVSNLPMTVAAASINSATSDAIEFAAFHGLSANAPLRVSSTGVLPPEIGEAATYYAIVVTSTAIQLATTPNGVAIDFSSDGSGTHTFTALGDGLASYFDTVNDLGVNLDRPWGDNYVCDQRNFVDISSQIVPTGTVPQFGNRVFDRVWRDELSGIVFTSLLHDGAATCTRACAIKLCEGLNGSAAGVGWHLPTHKEVMQLYVDGFTYLGGGWAGVSSRVWTSTIDLWGAGFYGTLEFGHFDYQPLDASSRVICTKE